MRNYLLFLILLMASIPLAAEDGATMPKADQRVIREIQSHAYGTPTLQENAPMQDSLLALAALGATAATPGDKAIQSDDYVALLALLQRYRDDLLKMGMDSSELRAQLEILESRTNELETRLKALVPRDGLKIYGRFYTAFDDLQVVGPGWISPTAGLSGLTNMSVGKPLGQGVRTQIGVFNSDLTFEGTRGPVTADAELDLEDPWGGSEAGGDTFGTVAFRRIMLEFRLPVVLQFGDLRTALTPLTLWRNDSSETFEPEPFADRRQRMEDDLLLEPNKWTITGLRAATDARIFNLFTLHIESVTGMVGYAAAIAPSSLSQQVIYVTGENNPAGFQNVMLGERFNTYLQGWKVALPLLDNALTLSYNGSMFWDVSSTAPGLGQYMPMNELVQTGGIDYKADHFYFQSEAALSSYQNPWLTYTAEATEGALTGTAITAEAGWKGDSGYLRVFGRTVSSGFHAAGAQGRTVDYSYQYLGPFLTENSQVGANGSMGLGGGGGGSIPLSNASRLNDQLIPPGTVVLTPNLPVGKTFPTAIVWQHLLPYGPGEEIDPYGVATPNRAGGGLQGEWEFFNGLLVPMASAEFFQEQDDVSTVPTWVTYTAGTVLNPFTMSRYRAGLEVNLEPWINWPIRFGGGMTMTDSQNGQEDANGVAYNLATQLIDASVQWNAGKPYGLALGYRNMVATGQDETFTIPTGPDGQSVTWDLVGVGAWWRPEKGMSLDLVSTEGHQESSPVNTWQDAQNVIRYTLEF